MAPTSPHQASSCPVHQASPKNPVPRHLFPQPGLRSPLSTSAIRTLCAIQPLTPESCFSTSPGLHDKLYWAPFPTPVPGHRVPSPHHPFCLDSLHSFQPLSSPLLFLLYVTSRSFSKGHTEPIVFPHGFHTAQEIVTESQLKDS